MSANLEIISLRDEVRRLQDQLRTLKESIVPVTVSSFTNHEIVEKYAKDEIYKEYMKKVLCRQITDDLYNKKAFEFEEDDTSFYGLRLTARLVIVQKWE